MPMRPAGVFSINIPNQMHARIATTKWIKRQQFKATETLSVFLYIYISSVDDSKEQWSLRGWERDAVTNKHICAKP